MVFKKTQKNTARTSLCGRDGRTQCWERSQAKVISNQNQNHRAKKVILNQNKKSPVSK